MSALPRILCLHGGGVNAEVFRLQCRAIAYSLRERFRLVFADGPFSCPPHPDIIEVYGDYGPFYRWLRWKPDEHAPVDARLASRRIVDRCRRAMDADPGTGPWVAVLGFSQGAKVAASLLWAQEHMAPDARPLPEVTFSFGVLMAGSAPVVMLDPTDHDHDHPPPPYIVNAAHVSLVPPSPPHSSSSTARDGSDGIDEGYDPWPPTNEHGAHLVSIPTLHVHGLKDSGIALHRLLLHKYCKAGTARLVEWDGAHRLPISTKDVNLVVSRMLEMAKEAGIRF